MGRRVTGGLQLLGFLTDCYKMWLLQRMSSVADEMLVVIEGFVVGYGEEL